MATLLAACLIVKDEAEDLPRCLASLQGWVDEIVVVDTGSSDDTVAIAEVAGAHVLHHRWTDDFSAARNLALASARSTWCLVIDGDEAVAAKSAAGLRALLQETDAAALRVVVRNHLPPGGVLSWRDEPVLRLVRSDPGHRFEGRIHEQIGVSVQRAGGRIEACSLVLDHFGYARSTAQGHPRAERNLRLLRAMLEVEPGDAYLRFHEGCTLLALHRWEDAERSLDQAWTGPELGADSQATCACKRAQLALRRNDAPAAVERAAQALRIRPDDPLAMYLLGVAAADLGQWDVAIGAFEGLLRRPEVARSWRAQIEGLLYARKAVRSQE